MQISSGNEFNASDNICNCNKDMRAMKTLSCVRTRHLSCTPTHTITDHVFSIVIIVLVEEVADTNGK